jgi:2-methylcitrate dehydratase PrpD
MEVIVNALGIAGSQAGTIMEFLHDGSWTKMMHPGWGALSAVYALKMAKAGLTGPKTVFEGQYGVFPVHLGTVGTLPEQLATLGKKWLTPDIAFKLYPCCHHNHSFIDVLKKLMHDHQFTAADIEAIEARGTPMCALKGKITAEEINLKYCSDPDVLEMIDRITFITDESIAVKGHMPAKLCVTLKDGRRFCGEQKNEKSARENPIALQDILDKYYGCVSNYLDSGKADAVAQKALNFERLDGIGALLSDMAH